MKGFLKRVFGVFLVLFGVLVMTFIMLRVIPGNPASVLLNEHASQAAIDRITRSMGLDKPLPEQFLIYLAGVVRGDLGRSYNLSRPVADLIAEAFPGTLRLALAAALFAWCFGITAGVISAVFDNRLPDFLCMGVSLLGVSVPVFMVALTLQYLLYFKLGILPLTVDGTLPSLIMPAIALGWNSAGNVARLTRSSLIEQKSAPYIETAMAKGLTRRAAIVRHGLKNAFLPVLTLMALQLSDMLSGAVITETIFGIPGLGKLSLSAALTRDMPLLQGTVLFSAFLIAAGSVIADFLNTVLDPRIRE